MNLDRLNSLTKYPSILTFHKLGEKGRLLDELSTPLPVEALSVTEKIDGCNARIIISPDGDFFIGSREELLHAKGDRICNPAQGIVDTIASVADRVSPVWARSAGRWGAIFGEVYGHNKGKSAKNYATSASAFPVFDILLFDHAEIERLTSFPREELAAWRDSGGQPFLPDDRMADICRELELAMVPRLDCPPPPVDVGQTAAWLRDVSLLTRGALDAAPGSSEGVVIRTRTRSFIAKARHEDYERTLKARK
jgi:hypothetical protein